MKTSSQKKAESHLLAGILTAILFFVTVIPAFPVFMKIILNFPKLENSHHWVGKVRVDGELFMSSKKKNLPKFYIITAGGTYEFKCGYFGDRRPCRNYDWIDGADGEIWYDSIFGVIQMRMVINTTNHKKLNGRIIEMPINVREDAFRNNFPYRRYAGRLAAAIGIFALSIWNLNRYYVLRRL